jgi:Mg2+/citrate symporter
MRYPERWIRFHLSVLTLVALAIIVALAVDGLGLAFIAAIGLGIVLAIGYPLLVMRAEGRTAPPGRRRP